MCGAGGGSIAGVLLSALRSRRGCHQHGRRKVHGPKNRGTCESRCMLVPTGMQKAWLSLIVRVHSNSAGSPTAHPRLCSPWAACSARSQAISAPFASQAVRQFEEREAYKYRGQFNAPHAQPERWTSIPVTILIQIDQRLGGQWGRPTAPSPRPTRCMRALPVTIHFIPAVYIYWTLSVRHQDLQSQSPHPRPILRSHPVLHHI